MKEQGGLGQWLKDRCEQEHMSFRQVAIKVGVSHQTIASLANSNKPLPQTIKKLAKAFGGDNHQRIALEDKLMSLAGYRTERPEEELSEPLARILDKLNDLEVAQLGIVDRFIDFLAEKQDGKD